MPAEPATPEQLAREICRDVEQALRSAGIITTAHYDGALAKIAERLRGRDATLLALVDVQAAELATLRAFAASVTQEGSGRLD